MKKILNPLSDLVFKRIFGTEKEILIEFINIFIELDNPVISIEFLPLELLSESREEKTPVVDVRCIDAANRHFILEIQISSQVAFIKRALFYLSRVYGRQLVRGNDYVPLEPVYLLSLLNFQLFPALEDCYQSFSMRSDQQRETSIEGLHLIFLELPKLKKRTNFNSASLKDYWMLFLTEPEKLQHMRAHPLHEYPNLLKAVELLDESNYTPAQLAAYDRYMDNIRTYNSVMITKYDEGHADGMEKGLEKGMEKGRENGINEERLRLFSIIEEIQKGEKTLEEIATKFNEPIEIINKLKGL